MVQQLRQCKIARRWYLQRGGVCMRNVSYQGGCPIQFEITIQSVFWSNIMVHIIKMSKGFYYLVLGVMGWFKAMRAMTVFFFSLFSNNNNKLENIQRKVKRFHTIFYINCKIHRFTQYLFLSWAVLFLKSDFFKL